MSPLSRCIRRKLSTGYRRKSVDKRSIPLTICEIRQPIVRIFDNFATKSHELTKSTFYSPFCDVTVSASRSTIWGTPPSSRSDQHYAATGGSFLHQGHFPRTVIPPFYEIQWQRDQQEQQHQQQQQSPHTYSQPVNLSTIHYTPASWRPPPYELQPADTTYRPQPDIPRGPPYGDPYPPESGPSDRPESVPPVPAPTRGTGTSRGKRRARQSPEEDSDEPARARKVRKVSRKTQIACDFCRGK